MELSNADEKHEQVKITALIGLHNRNPGVKLLQFNVYARFPKCRWSLRVENGLSALER
jgi:hypothetical protein